MGLSITYLVAVTRGVGAYAGLHKYDGVVEDIQQALMLVDENGEHKLQVYFAEISYVQLGIERREP